MSYDYLDLEARLNVDRDLRAKAAIKRAVENLSSHPVTLSLPLEAAVVVLDGVKQTADLAKELRYHIGKVKARQFYANEQLLRIQTYSTPSPGNRYDCYLTEDRRCSICGTPRSAPGTVVLAK